MKREQGKQIKTIEHILLGKITKSAENDKVPVDFVLNNIIRNSSKYNTSVGNCPLIRDKKPHYIVKFANQIRNNIVIEIRYYIPIELIPIEKREETRL